MPLLALFNARSGWRPRTEGARPALATVYRQSGASPPIAQWYGPEPDLFELTLDSESLVGKGDP